VDDLSFDPHARDEMARDSISEDEVYRVEGDADRELVQRNGHTRCERMMEDGRYLVVIVNRDAAIVMTVWWDKRSSRRTRRWT
jgi:hypothetical protein